MPSRPAMVRAAFRALAVGLTLLAALARTARPQDTVREVTLLYTNDFHSAFDPIPAYWLPGAPKLGGAAHLAGLVQQIRRRERPVFLFDTGDMFTGMISNLTRGEALMEMMRAMEYDALAIGNHEFDYGAENFTRQMNRVPFPVLGANIFYKETRHPYARPYMILEALPFVNTVVTCEMTAAEIREVLEQGFTLERGMVQVSGMRATYDLSRPAGSRLVWWEIGGQSPDENRRYRVATNSFLAQGGDLYRTFLRVPQHEAGLLLSELVMNHFRKQGTVAAPTLGRLLHAPNPEKKP